MNKKIEKKRNIENLKRLTLLNILSSKGVVYRYYKLNYKTLILITFPAQA